MTDIHDKESWVREMLGDDVTALARLTSVQVTQDQLEFASTLASLRNLMVDHSGKKMRRKSTRKAILENWISHGESQARTQLAAMFAALGPLPINDDDALSRYAKAALKWSEKFLK